MTAKEYIKNVYPKARAERQKTTTREVYWLIRPEPNAMYISTGKTELGAWLNGKKQLIANSLPI